MDEARTLPSMDDAFAATLVFDLRGIRALDARAIAEHGRSGLELMETAAIRAVEVACDMLPQAGGVIVACGPGNNGGDGWAMARLLHEQGHEVEVVSPVPTRPGTDAATNEARTRAMGLPVVQTMPGQTSADLVIDALLGTGLTREMRHPIDAQVCSINALNKPVLSVDLPSGLNTDTGLPMADAVIAECTVTFAGWKRGLCCPPAALFAGRVKVVDIGMPSDLARSLAEACLDD